MLHGASWSGALGYPIPHASRYMQPSYSPQIKYQVRPLNAKESLLGYLKRDIWTLFQVNEKKSRFSDITVAEKCIDWMKRFRLLVINWSFTLDYVRLYVLSWWVGIAGSLCRNTDVCIKLQESVIWNWKSCLDILVCHLSFTPDWRLLYWTPGIDFFSWCASIAGPFLLARDVAISLQ